MEKGEMSMATHCKGLSLFLGTYWLRVCPGRVAFSKRMQGK